MFLAYVLKFSRSNPDEKVPHTFFCREHSASHLVTQLSRYQTLLNEIESTDYIFQLITISDMGQSLSPTTIQNLGAFQLTNELLYEMKQAKLKNQGGARFMPRVVENPTSPSEDLLEDISIQRAFNLPKVTELVTYRDIPNLHPIAKELMVRGQLWLIHDDQDRIFWRLEAGKTVSREYTEGQVEGPCFLVQNDSTYYLSASNPFQNEVKSNEG